MSEHSWLAEHYFVDAKDLVSDNYSDIDRLEHAKIKWSGFSQEALSKHSINKTPISYETTSCAMCCKYKCEECTVTKVTGDSCVNSYSEAIATKNPQPMLDLLEKVRSKI